MAAEIIPRCTISLVSARSAHQAYNPGKPKAAKVVPAGSPNEVPEIPGVAPAQNSDAMPVIEEFKMDMEPPSWQKWAHAIMYISPAILWTVNGAMGVQEMARHACTKEVSQESIDQYTCGDGTVVSSFWEDQYCNAGATMSWGDYNPYYPIDCNKLSMSALAGYCQPGDTKTAANTYWSAVYAICPADPMDHAGQYALYILWILVGTCFTVVLFVASKPWTSGTTEYYMHLMDLTNGASWHRITMALNLFTISVGLYGVVWSLSNPSGMALIEVMIFVMINLGALQSLQVDLGEAEYDNSGADLPEAVFPRGGKPKYGIKWYRSPKVVIVDNLHRQMLMTARQKQASHLVDAAEKEATDRSFHKGNLEDSTLKFFHSLNQIYQPMVYALNLIRFTMSITRALMGSGPEDDGEGGSINGIYVRGEKSPVGTSWQYYSSDSCIISADAITGESGCAYVAICPGDVLKNNAALVPFVLSMIVGIGWVVIIYFVTNPSKAGTALYYR